MTARTSTVLVWFGVLGGGLAWAAQHVANIELSFARCSATASRFPVAVHPLSIVLTVLALLVAAGAEAAALAAFRATRDEDSPPPAGRVHFLAAMGLTINPLAAAIILMSGVGTLLLPVCHQS